MKSWLSALLVIGVMQIGVGCKQASVKSIQAATGSPVSAGPVGSANAAAATCTVTTPVAELAAGGLTTQATATINSGAADDKGTVTTNVTWTVTQVSSKPTGSIDAAGLYKSPDTSTEKYPVTLTAACKQDDGSILTGTVDLNITPATAPSTLTVTLPVPDLKVGGLTTTAVASLSNGVQNPPVKWTVTGPAGKDFGNINADSGLYTSPLTGADQFSVIISATLISNPTITGSATLPIIPSDPAKLIVTVPSPDVRAGGSTIQAKAALADGTQDPPVTWSVVGLNGNSNGSIDPNTGVYTSPNSTTRFSIVISAILKADTRVKGSVSLNIIPNDTIFARCKKANAIFPIKADVYRLAVGAPRLPTNWGNQNYKATVCMDQYNVPEREFTSGFPDVQNLFEWFGLHTETTLIVPEDGNYTLRLISDDGARLWMNGQLKINNDGQHPTQSHDVDLYLKAGDYPIVLDYFQGPRYKISLILQWGKDKRNFRPIPRENFK